MRLLPPCGGGTRRGVAPSSAISARRASTIVQVRATPHPGPPPQGRAGALNAIDSIKMQQALSGCLRSSGMRAGADDRRSLLKL
jgi:hypothetical protein